MKLKLYTEAKQVHISGEYFGLPFAAMLDLGNKSAAWDHEAPIPFPPLVPPPLTKEQETATEAQKVCPGCVRGALKLMRGGMGWAKEIFGVGQVDKIKAAERKKLCESCPSNCYDFGICRDDWPDKPDEEQGCGCVLALKITQISEKCPHDHW